MIHLARLVVSLNVPVVTANNLALEFNVVGEGPQGPSSSAQKQA